MTRHTIDDLSQLLREHEGDDVSLHVGGMTTSRRDPLRPAPRVGREFTAIFWLAVAVVLVLIVGAPILLTWWLA